MTAIALSGNQTSTLYQQVLELIHANDHFDADTVASQVDLLKMNSDEIETFLKSISLEQLQEIVRTAYPDHVSALQTAKEMVQEAKHYLNRTENKISCSLKTCLQSILNTLLVALESILGTFGLASFFQASDNKLDADFKGQKIMVILSLFTILTGILMPVLGPALGAAIIGGIFAGIAALSLVYPLIKPQAANLPRGTNLTLECQQGDLLAADGRKTTLDEMAQTLIKNEQTKTHVMLIGKTGVGKTETAKAFVQAVERGDYPELSGKQVIYFNTSELLAGTEMFSTSNKIFSQISEAMGRYREDYILIFDEIHMACQKSEQGSLCEQLKTLLDPGQNKFPYVIGITTDEEYYREIYGNHAAFARRFKLVPIENTENSETLGILNSSFIKGQSKALLTQGTLQDLLNKTNAAFENAAQPATSLKILSQCIKKTASHRLGIEDKVDAVRRGLLNVYAQNAGRIPHAQPQMALQLEAQLKQLEEQLVAEKAQLAELTQNQDTLLELKKSVLKKVVEMQSLKEDALSNKNENALKGFLFQNFVQVQAIEEAIRTSAAALKVKVEISPELVSEVIDEELKNNQLAKEAIKKGQDELAKRAENLQPTQNP